MSFIKKLSIILNKIVVSQSGPARETRRISPMMMIFCYAIIRSSRPYTCRLFLRIYDLILGMALTSRALSLPFSRFRWTFWRYDEALPSTERPMPFVFLEVLQLYKVFWTQLGLSGAEATVDHMFSTQNEKIVPAIHFTNSYIQIDFLSKPSIKSMIYLPYI